MESIKIKNGELINLQYEISDVITKSKSFVSKFHINTLLEQISPSLKTYNKVHEELVKKYGTEGENGNVQVQEFVDSNAEEKIQTEEFKSFYKEYVDILNQEVDIQYTPLKIDTFKDLDTDKFYPVLFKFIKE